MNRVMWFDIPASDINASAEFYARVFGWNVLPKHEKDSGDELSFRVAQTEASDLPHLPGKPGSINGGIVTRMIGISHPTILVEVEDIAEKLAEIVAAGGKPVADKKALPLADGYFAYVEDPDGNVIGLWEWMADPAAEA